MNQIKYPHEWNHGKFEAEMPCFVRIILAIELGIDYPYWQLQYSEQELDIFFIEMERAIADLCLSTMSHGFFKMQASASVREH